LPGLLSGLSHPVRDIPSTHWHGVHEIIENGSNVPLIIKKQDTRIIIRPETDCQRATGEKMI